MQNLIKKYRDGSWDFKNAPTKLYTHIFHSYPAMMIPQVAGRILEEFREKSQTLLFDPYCGTGTSLVEANLRGLEGLGTDINPLARLIAKVKTTPISLEILDIYLKRFNDFLFHQRLGLQKNTPNLPNFQNIDFWFKKETQYMLALCREFIDNIDHQDIQDFFKVAFSETVREVSLTKNSEFKLCRMSPSEIDKFNPDVFTIILNKLIRNRKGMLEYLERKKNQASSKIYDFNTVEKIPEEILPSESVDIVITSPPYGDSRTTVAYGQFSRLSNQWLGLEEFNEVDKKCMGGKRVKTLKKFHFQPLDEVILKIGEIDENRAYEVISFYIDYEKSIKNVAKTVKKEGIVAYVVGNRKVKGYEIPNDEVTREFFEREGFRHLKTIIREIPNKRMPKKNSPSNKAGEIDTTMNYEYIVILKKEGG